MRFLIALATAIAMVAMLWPYLRQFAPRRQQPGGVSRPASKGELIYFAILITVVISFTISVLLWVFGGR